MSALEDRLAILTPIDPKTSGTDHEHVDLLVITEWRRSP
jgi:hypothetical protein